MGEASLPARQQQQQQRTWVMELESALTIGDTLQQGQQHCLFMWLPVRCVVLQRHVLHSRTMHTRVLSCVMEAGGWL
jgi:hypothetical protein